MENESSSRKFDSVYTNKVKAGKRRTYFFDVRKTKGDDYYIILTESTRRFNGNGYEKHKIFLYKEDFNRFIDALKDTIDFVKTDLLPDYDFDEYTKKNKEWEEKRKLELEEESDQSAEEVESANENEDKEIESEDDMEW